MAGAPSSMSFARERDALVDRLVQQVDEDATGESGSCQRADVCALIKPVL